MVDSAQPDPRNLRVSDAEREHVVELLQHAVGRGLLDLEEFTARSDTALAAQTRAELNAVLLDLPGVVHTQDAPPTSAVVATSRPVPAPVDDEPLIMRSTLGGIERKGEWIVPRRMVIQSRVGGTELDFAGARISDPEIFIDLDIAVGSAEFWLPNDATVNTNGVTVLLGKIDDRRRSAQPTRDGTRFVITGTIRAGSLVLRGPRKRLFG